MTNGLIVALVLEDSSRADVAPLTPTSPIENLSFLVEKVESPPPPYPLIG